MNTQTSPLVTIQNKYETTWQLSQEIVTNLPERGSDRQSSQLNLSSLNPGEHIQLQSDLLVQTQESNELTKPSSMTEIGNSSLEETEKLNQLRLKFDVSWLSDDDLVWVLSDVMHNAVYQGPKGDIITDYKAKLSAAKELIKLRWYYKPQTVINVVNAFAKPPILY